MGWRFDIAVFVATGPDPDASSAQAEEQPASQQPRAVKAVCCIRSGTTAFCGRHVLPPEVAFTDAVYALRFYRHDKYLPLCEVCANKMP